MLIRFYKVIEGYIDNDYNVSLSIPVYPMGMLYGYKTNHLLPLPAEVSKVSIIVQINAGSLEGATFEGYISGTVVAFTTIFG